jgi:Predicted flavin-nucleotide-binding protein
MAEVTYFERLDVPECLRLLGGGGVGRVVWQGADGLTVLPVNYRLINGAVVFHTSPASPLARLAEPTQVAFQVDEIDHGTAVGWSVLVRGTSRPSEVAGSVSFLAHNQPVSVAVNVEEVTGRVISGNPVPQS